MGFPACVTSVWANSDTDWADDRQILWVSWVASPGTNLNEGGTSNLALAAQAGRRHSGHGPVPFSLRFPCAAGFSPKNPTFIFLKRGFGGTDGTAKCTLLLFCMKGTRQNPPHLVSRRMLERTFGGTAECWFPTFKCFRLLAVPPNPTPEEAEPVPGSWAQTGVSGFNFNLCAPSPCTTEGVFPSWWP